MYIPYVFRQFQGYKVKDVKEFRLSQKMEIILSPESNKIATCKRCGDKLGRKRGEYWIKAKHLKCMGWSVSVSIPVEKRECTKCKKIRSEFISFLCPTTSHMTLEMAWWINQLTEVTSVLRASHLEGIDKMTCYKVDKHILMRLLQGYEIPEVTHISVDEVYARGPKQKKEDETRDDLFLTVIVDLKTRKVIWVSKSRRKEALDSFFEVLGKEYCKKIKVVATDQHDAYAASVREYCPKAIVVWDRFHLVQNFNDALNEERKDEHDKEKKKNPELGKLIRGKYRFLFLMKRSKRSEKNQNHLLEVMHANRKMLVLELIKEKLHMMFDSLTREEAQEHLCDCYEWAMEVKAEHIKKWIWNIMDKENFWNYFEHRVTTSVSEGINRVIKGLKWQAYGYKDMAYFGLKIMQKCGYLNYRYYLMATN
jgi:transposase